MRFLIIALSLSFTAFCSLSAFSVVLSDMPGYYHSNSLSAEYEVKFGNNYKSLGIGYDYNTDSQNIFANAKMIHLRAEGSDLSLPLDTYSTHFLDWVADGGVLYIDNLEGNLSLPDFDASYSFNITNNIKAPDINHELIIQSGISWIHYTPRFNHTFSSVNGWGAGFTAIFNFYKNFNWNVPTKTALAIQPYGEGTIIFSTGYFGASISEYALSLSTIPEASTYALILGGTVLGYAFLRRRK